MQWTARMDVSATWHSSSEGNRPTVGKWVARRLLGGGAGSLWYRVCVLPEGAFSPAPSPHFGIGQLTTTQHQVFQDLCAEVNRQTGIGPESVENLFNLHLFSMIRQNSASGTRATQVWLLMCYTPQHAAKVRRAKQDAFHPNHPIPTISFLQKLFEGPKPIAGRLELTGTALFDIIADACPDSKPTELQKVNGPKVAKLVVDALVNMGVLVPNAPAICYGIVASDLCPFPVWYGTFHPSPLGAPLLAKVVGAWAAIIAVEYHAERDAAAAAAAAATAAAVAAASPMPAMTLPLQPMSPQGTGSSINDPLVVE